MRHSRPITLHVEALEARKLLSNGSIVAAHINTETAAAKPPLLLNGTLAVDSKAASTTTNMDGSTATAVPVVGQLGTLGQVHGYWAEGTNAFGNSTGVETLMLHAPNGNLLIGFNTQNSGRGRRLGHGNVAFPHAQKLYSGTGTYANATESGTVEVITNARTHVQSLELSTKPT